MMVLGMVVGDANVSTLRWSCGAAHRCACWCWSTEPLERYAGRVVPVSVVLAVGALHLLLPLGVTAVEALHLLLLPLGVTAVGALDLLLHLDAPFIDTVPTVGIAGVGHAAVGRAARGR